MLIINALVAIVIVCIVLIHKNKSKKTVSGYKHVAEPKQKSTDTYDYRWMLYSSEAERYEDEMNARRAFTDEETLEECIRIYEEIADEEWMNNCLQDLD